MSPHTVASDAGSILATKNEKVQGEEISSPASRQHAQTWTVRSHTETDQYHHIEVPSQEKLYTMPSAAALRAQQEKDVEFAPSNPFDGADEGLLLGTASDVVAEVAAKTNLFDAARDDIFPRFDDGELVLGRVLGRGGFCVVNEVKAVNLNSSGPGDDHEKKSGEKDQGYMRGFIKARCIRDGGARYAVKQLSEESREDKTKFLKGTIDLAIEAKFLAVLDHPHIIKMRGASSFGPFNAPGYFLVLDKLTETLEDRLRKWVKTESKTKGVLGKVTGGKKKKDKMTLEKAHVAYDLATALKFMHSNGIIYRDVKPDNIGFDVRGEVKVFDMGLAKELQDSERNKDGTYNLTGFTGSIRYMAPEVAKSQPYNLSADVYSYGMLLWHVFANEPPFITYSCKMHDELVVHKGYRPSVDPKWPATFGDLMKECWSNNPSKRPDFSYITEILAEETLRLDPDEVCCLDLDISRRSIGN